MAIVANDSRFHLQLPALNDELQVVAFECTEGLSELYECRIELTCRRNNLPLASVLSTPALLTIYDEQHPRLIHGEIAEAAQGNVECTEGDGYNAYFFTLRPRLWWLAHRSGLRIFQKLSVPDLIAKVLGEAGLALDDVRFDLKGLYPVRDYCTQYRETDLAFISRLLEEEGLFYYFEHELSRHVLVVSDDSERLQPISGAADIAVIPRTGQVSDVNSVYDFQYARQLYSDAVSLGDFDFEKPQLDLNVRQQGAEFDSLETRHYAAGSGYRTLQEGQRYAQIELERQQMHRVSARGLSDCHRLQAGRRFTLRKSANTPGAPFVLDLILTRVTLQGRQPQALEEQAGAGGSEFSVAFECLPVTQPYRPPRHFPRPIAFGVQTAFVTGPKKETLYTDRHGRIKVQFHWDREGRRNEQSSCWLRVAHAWAGNGWGSFSLPRTGQEVIVTFLNGDPDQPIVTGSLYNTQTQPPYDLPAHKTRTTFKSQTAPDGGGYNELRLDDKKGQEQIFIHARKNLDIHLQNRRRDHIGHDLHRIVQGASYDHTGQKQHTRIGAQQYTRIDGLLSLDVGQDLQQKTGQDHIQQAGVNVSLKANQNVILDAGQSLTLKAQGSSIVLDTMGVSVTGLMININSGGGAASAQSARTTAPKATARVDPGNPGHSLPALTASRRRQRQPVEFDTAQFKATTMEPPTTPAGDGGGGLGTDNALSLSLDLLPVVGTVKGIAELALGFDPVTGESIPRWVSAAGIAASITPIPGAKAAVRGASKAGKMAKKGDGVVESSSETTVKTTALAPQNPQHLELVSSHKNAHSIQRHGGKVTDKQLMHRALTGEAPDGHKKFVKGKTILPPMSSAFHSDELLLYADQAVRNDGALEAVIAQNPGKSVITVKPSDAGDLGVDLGRGYERIAGSKLRPEMQGAPNHIRNLRSVQATYEFNPTKQAWETITIFPAR